MHLVLRRTALAAGRPVRRGRPVHAGSLQRATTTLLTAALLCALPPHASSSPVVIKASPVPHQQDPTCTSTGGAGSARCVAAGAGGGSSSNGAGPGGNGSKPQAVGGASVLYKMGQDQQQPQPHNVLGGPLDCCCTSPVTGYYRDGYCRTDASDRGRHVVCAQVTREFLEYSKTQGNDLMTPAPHFSFPGLKPGDKWCLCALRWLEAHNAGCAPNVFLKATHTKVLEYVDLEVLQKYAVDQA